MSKIRGFLIEYLFGKPSPHYGHGFILRKILNYPSWLPLNVQIQHGWYAGSLPDHEKEDQISVMLVWSNRLAEQWKSRSNKPVYVLGAPFVHYRRMKNIQKNPDATGSVVFPTHSTPRDLQVFSVEDFDEALKKLPDHYKPITICLHFRDMEQYGDQFREKGYTVVTAGNSRQKNDGFTKKFYEILRRHKFCISNEVGSYAIYAIEMGIPFFLYGPDSVVVLRDSPEIVVEKDSYLEEQSSMFQGLTESISPDQEQYIRKETGIDDCIDMRSLKKILIHRLLFYELPRYPLRIFKILFYILPCRLFSKKGE